MTALQVGVPETVTREQILEKMRERWGELFRGGPELPLEQPDTFGKLADRVRTAVLAQALTVHPLHPIIVAGLGTIVEHAEALDQLKGKKVAPVHARQIDELATTLLFLVKNVGRYDEFAWRWKAFKTVQGIRNRLHNLKGQLDPQLLAWIKANKDRLKSVSSKFKDDVGKDTEDFWLRYSNWLYPIMIKQIFEDTGRKASYDQQDYAWESHFVHFSPLSDNVYGYPQVFLDQMDVLTELRIREPLKTLLPVAADQRPQVRLHMMLVYRDWFLTARDEPARFHELMIGKEWFRAFVGAVIRPDASVEALQRILIGEVEKDPLVVIPSANGVAVP